MCPFVNMMQDPVAALAGARLCMALGSALLHGVFPPSSLRCGIWSAPSFSSSFSTEVSVGKVRVKN